MIAAVAAGPVLAQTPMPAGKVEGHIVAHPGTPALKVGVPATATYVGAERFTLYGVADCEIHVFVEADEQKRIRKLYWIQFEGYLPSRPDARYEYGENDRRMELWGQAAWMRIFLSRTERPTREGSDSERVRSILTRAGYIAPPHLMMVRLVRLLDDPQGTGYGRSELMMIYAEDMAPTGLTVDDVTTDGKSNARWTALEQPLIDRAAAAFSVKAR